MAVKRAQDPVRVQLNSAVVAVERHNRATAIKLLAGFGVLTSAKLKAEQLQPALEAFEAALTKLDGGKS